VPFVLLSAGASTSANDIQFVASSCGANTKTIDNYSNWTEERIKSWSTLEHACMVKITTSDGYIKYNKSNGATNITIDAEDIYNKMSETNKRNLVASSGAVLKVNGITPDDNGNI
jgi:hypothetical protein